MVERNKRNPVDQDPASSLLAERHDGRRMTVHDCVDVAARSIDRGMNEAFEVRGRPVRLDGIAIEVELYVVGKSMPPRSDLIHIVPKSFDAKISI